MQQPWETVPPSGFTGTLTNNPFTASRPTVNDLVFVANTGNPFNRLEIYAGGAHWWGDGTNAVDTNIARTAVSELSLGAGDSLRLGNGSFFHWGNAANQQTTVGAAGGASALPATPVAYLKVKDSDGNTRVIPCYNP